MKSSTFGFIIASVVLVTNVDGFAVIHHTSSLRRSNIAQFVIDPVTASSIAESSPSFTLAEESWRQYVPLIVSACVIVDILLGSPLANMVLAPMRGGQDEEEEGDDGTGSRTKTTPVINKSKERIDTEQVAQDAINRAQNALELRRFLDEQKTDWDRMEDMKRKLDSEMKDLDEDLQAREESLAKRRDNPPN